MKRFAIFLLAAPWFAPLQSRAGDWAQWRGPEQNGVSRERDLPETWSPDPKASDNNLVWSAPYGARSTPIVMGGRVFMINDVDQGVNEQERIVCLDANTGKLLWEKRFNVFLVDIVSSRVGWTNLAGDPETGYIYAHGTQGYLTCLDRDGKIIWQRSLTEDCGRFCGYGGRLSSPVVDGDLVIVGMVNASYGDQARGANRFLAVDKKTGTTVWWAETGEKVNDTYYSTPVVAVINGQRLLISGGGDGFIHAFQIRTGVKVWSFPVAAKALNGSPVVDGNLVYIGNGEENYGESSVQGRVVCLDASKVTNKKPELVWKVDEVKATFASPVILDGRLYVAEENGTLFCFNSKSGERIWKIKYGRVARGSPVLADGKIYISDVNARFVILKPGDKKCVKMHEQVFAAENDQAIVELNGSAAVASGRVFIPTADALYCIGKPEHKAAADKIPDPAKEPAVEKDAKVARLLAYPAEVALHAGESVTFKVRAYDADGRYLRDVSAEWSLPAPPPPTGTTASPPALKGTITADGKLTVGAIPNQQGIAVAKADGLDATVRVRVVPTLPFTQDFKKVPEGRTPGGWLNCQGKFAVEKKDGSLVLRKLTVNPNPLVARANAFMALPSATDYTIESDVAGDYAGQNLPDMGIVNCRYTFVMSGKKQELHLASWDALPRVEKVVKFEWKPNVWYRMKLIVEVKGDKALVRGKMWPRDKTEPEAWSIEFEDPCPNREGAPALYGYAVGITEKELAPIWYDNVNVTPNKKTP